MQKFCLTLDLKDDPELIAAYDRYHQEVWPEILDSIRDAGILSMEIYRLHTRMFMIIEADDDFSFERKAEMDQKNPKVQEWEKLMWQYQEALPQARAGEKWLVLDKIFSFFA